LKGALENNSNFKPAEMLFYLYEFRSGMDIRHAKPLLQVHRGLYSVGSHEQVGLVDTGSGSSQCAKLFTPPFNAPIIGFSKTIESSGKERYTSLPVYLY